MRKFPSTLNVGDSCSVEFALPTDDLQDGEVWSSCDLDMRLKDDSAAVSYSLTATLSGSTATLRLPADAAIEDGVWSYRIRAAGNASAPTTITLESGTANVLDVLNPKLSPAARNVRLLESVIAEKLAGRGDVIAYEIDNRSTSTMQMSELQQSYSYWKEIADREIAPRRNWFEDDGYGC